MVYRFLSHESTRAMLISMRQTEKHDYSLGGDVYIVPIFHMRILRLTEIK